MKKVLCYCLAFLAVLALTPYAFADSVVGTAGDGWQSWVQGNVNENAVPYWDNTSADGSHMNVGYLLTGTQGSGSGIAGYPGAIPFWGGAYNPGSGLADPSFYLTSSGSSQAALKIEIAGLAGSNTFGWYNASTGATHELFNGPAGTGATATFTPTPAYGFYFGTANGLFKTESTSAGSADVGNQHFALFQGTDGYWLGMEDTLFATSDKDYNDMIVKIAPVPEPGVLLLLGLGLLGGAGVRRKFQI